MTDRQNISRRTALKAALGGTAAVATRGLAAPAANLPSLTGPYLDLTTGMGNMLAMSRIVGDLDFTKQKHG